MYSPSNEPQASSVLLNRFKPLQMPITNSNTVRPTQAKQDISDPPLTKLPPIKIMDNPKAKQQNESAGFMALVAATEYYHNNDLAYLDAVPPDHHKANRPPSLVIPSSYPPAATLSAKQHVSPMSASSDVSSVVLPRITELFVDSPVSSSSASSSSSRKSINGQLPSISTLKSPRGPIGGGLPTFNGRPVHGVSSLGNVSPSSMQGFYDKAININKNGSVSPLNKAHVPGSRLSKLGNKVPPVITSMKEVSIGPMSAEGFDDTEDARKKRYLCTICSKRFARPSSLQQHLRCHTREKPFSCNACKKSFSILSNLRRHFKIHGDEIATELTHQLNLQYSGTRRPTDLSSLEMVLSPYRVKHHSYPSLNTISDETDSDASKGS